MEKEELKDLLLKSLTEEISDSERELLETEVIGESGFSNGFRERVISSLVKSDISAQLHYKYSGMINKLFSRIVLTGAVAIVALLISIFISQGSLSYETLIGIDSSVDDGLLSLLIE